MNLIYKLTRSSDGTGNLSLTIKGILTFLIPVIIYIAAHFGVTILETDLVSMIDGIVTIVAGVTIVLGLSKKFYFLYQNRQ